MAYERSKIFEDWYLRKERLNQRLDELRNRIVQELRFDSRYRSFTLDYLNDL